MWTDFTASFLYRGASRSSTVGRKNILSIERATMRSISRTLIESSWNLSIEPDRAHEQTLEEVSGRGNSTPVIVDRKSTRLNSSHSQISYAVFCLKKKKKKKQTTNHRCKK